MDVLEVLAPVGRLIAAFVLALPLAWDREQADRSLGMRTFPLVAIGACGFVTAAEMRLSDSSEAISKVVEGIVAGIGFLGAAAVVKRGVTVHGTATAAAIWVTAAIGVASAFGAWSVGIALSVMAFAMLRFLTPIKAAATDGVEPADRPGDETVLDDDDQPRVRAAR
jgi:putative Mg2+ transporter-C (MgtC) family protein